MRRIVVIALLLSACSREQPRVSIGAAALLRHAMPELVAQYEAKSGVHIEVTYGASNALAEQVRREVPLDGLVLAEDAVLDELVAAGRVAADSRREVAVTQIVLVGPAGAGLTFATLTSLPADAKLAIGDPATVPVGRYARAYLQSLGAWDPLQSRLVLGGDVAGVLAHAQRGAARVAIVYRTDAKSAAPLVILDEPRDAPVAHIVAGTVSGASHPKAARAFVAFIAAGDGQAILARHGFAAPPR